MIHYYIITHFSKGKRGKLGQSELTGQHHGPCYQLSILWFMLVALRNECLSEKFHTLHWSHGQNAIRELWKGLVSETLITISIAEMPGRKELN